MATVADVLSVLLVVWTPTVLLTSSRQEYDAPGHARAKVGHARVLLCHARIMIG